MTSPAPSQDGATSLEGGQLDAAISNGLVQLLSEYTGRGPTRARTYLNGSMVVCVLRDTLTKGERVAVEILMFGGEPEAVSENL